MSTNGKFRPCWSCDGAKAGEQEHKVESQMVQGGFESKSLGTNGVIQLDNGEEEGRPM